MNKLKLKKRKPRKIIDKIALILFVIIISLTISYFLIKYISKKVTPFYMSYAESETKKLLTLIINKAVTKQIAEDMDIDSIFNTVKNDKGDIQLIEYNSVNVTKILNKITSYVQLNLKSVEEGDLDNLDLPGSVLIEYDKNKLKDGIIYEIPLGAISQSAFLSNLGPKIPVKMKLIGDIISGITTDVKEYGINNVLIEVGITIEVSSRINLPFLSKIITVQNIIPISLKVIQGNIPSYYLNGLKNNSNLITSNS